jgi:hypothetical protein
MSKSSAIQSLRDSFEALIRQAPTFADNSTQTDNEMHFTGGHCVALAVSNGNAIVRYNNAITPDNSTIIQGKQGKKRSRANSDLTLGTLGTFSASPPLSLLNPDDIENTPPLNALDDLESNVKMHRSVMKERSCACCGQEYQASEVPVAFGFTRPDPYGRTNVHTHCVGCRSFKKSVRKGGDSPGNSSVVTTRLRHAVLKRGLNEVCVLRRNGETWKMAYHRLKAKHGDFLANRKDELIQRLCDATGVTLEQGYVVFCQSTELELFYRVKRLTPKSFSSDLCPKLK